MSVLKSACTASRKFPDVEDQFTMRSRYTRCLPTITSPPKGNRNSCDTSTLSESHLINSFNSTLDESPCVFPARQTLGIKSVPPSTPQDLKHRSRASASYLACAIDDSIAAATLHDSSNLAQRSSSSWLYAMPRTREYAYGLPPKSNAWRIESV